MIGLLHGYLLDGSGSNLWTRAVVRALCGMGETVHLFCQEPEPERYDFVAEAVLHDERGSERLFVRDVPYPGRCVMHRPEIGPMLPVFVTDRYAEFERVVPMVDLPESTLRAYVRRNARVVMRVVRAEGIPILVANHTVLMPVVARWIREATGVPYAVVPHGSALEYAVRPDERLQRMAADALDSAARVFVVGREMRERMLLLFPDVPSLDRKLRPLPLGVDTAAFTPVERSGRRERVAAIAESLVGTPRGRGPAQAEALERAFGGRPAPVDLAGALHALATYEDKRPDERIEERLLSLDWEASRIALFVGRLIAAKGPQSLIAALPLVLEREARAKLVVVGHGPLREVLEALVLALRRGERAVVRRIADSMQALEAAVSGEEVPMADDAGNSVRALLDALEAEGRLDGYFLAARGIGPETVTFTGYLTHAELRHLYPCCDAAVFPSLVVEAGPLVFLEALASGCLPLGTDFGGMAESIAAAASALPEADRPLMRLSPKPDRVADDIARKLPLALERGGRDRLALREVAVRHYDWSRVAGNLLDELDAVPRAARASRRAGSAPEPDRSRP